jgi:putative radical SAM enzyme (TIGR03279 family)
MPKPGDSGEISFVEADSLAAEAGLAPGDRVLSANGRPIRDQIDYRFLVADDVVELEVEADGERGIVEFEKHPDAGLGIEFSDSAFDGTRICNNKCFFCFLKGLPKGLRKTLYVKDDDYRLSFEHGNFVTLTNLSADDWARLREQRLSPLHVSVHATNPALRRLLLGNPRAPDIRAQLRDLAEWGIDVHTQVVLCSGVNDGAALDETVGELISHANVLSVGVVPVGASVDAEDRAETRGVGELDEVAGMRAVTRQEARLVLRQLRHWRREAAQAGRPAAVFASDEFYLCGEARIPSAKAYGGFPQWENGVGMVRTLIDDWRRIRRRLRRRQSEGRSIELVRPLATLACGTLAAPRLRELATEAGELIGGRIDVVAVDNHLFGQRVNVSGLLPGKDFCTALEGRPVLSDTVFLPRASLDYYGERFLDDTTPAEISARVGRPLAFAYTLSEVIQWMQGMAPEPPGTGERSNGRSWAVRGG